MYVLRTGCQWKALPKEYGSGSTAHRRFQQWVREGAFQKLWVNLLIRWEKKAENYLGLVQLACSIMVYRRIILG